jgi:zinc transport system substrate-binding protein
MIDAISEELAALSPEHAEDFVARASALKEQLREKDVEWQAAINALPTKDIVTFHDAFMYFADDFGLTVIATFEPFPGKEPTAKYLQNLQAEIAAAGIADLFLEPQLSADAIESFARDNKIDLGVLDPIGGVPGRDSYISLIDYNVDQIVQSLQN